MDIYDLELPKLMLLRSHIDEVPEMMNGSHTSENESYR